jgi:transcriptional regulator with GAF, ATPase, and Fis domain
MTKADQEQVRLIRRYLRTYEPPVDMTWRTPWPHPADPGATYDDQVLALKLALIREALACSHSMAGAARRLGMQRTRLYYEMARFGITWTFTEHAA